MPWSVGRVVRPDFGVAARRDFRRTRRGGRLAMMAGRMSGMMVSGMRAERSGEDHRSPLRR